MVSSKFFLKFFVFSIFLVSFFLSSSNQANAALHYDYIGPVRCDWSFEKIDTDKVNPVLRLSVGKGTRDYTASETLTYAILEVLPALSALGIYVFASPIQAEILYGPYVLSTGETAVIWTMTTNWVALALQVAPLGLTIGTFLSALGVEPPRELGLVKANITIYVDGNKFYETSTSFGNIFSSIKTPFTLDGTSKHTIRVKIKRIGGEKVYEKDFFYREVNDWECSFEWDPAHLGSLEKEELCKAIGLKIEGKWINSQQMQVNVTSSPYCSGYTAQIGCGYQSGTLDNEGKITFVLEGCKDGTEVYVELPYPGIKSNSIRVIYPKQYLTDQPREGDELRVNPREGSLLYRFTQSNYPEYCLDESKINGVLVGVPGDYNPESIVSVPGMRVSVYDKGKIVCEGYSDVAGSISCEPFQCFDRIVVDAGTDYETVAYDLMQNAPFSYTIKIVLRKKVRGYEFKIWVRGRTTEGSNGVANAAVTLMQKTGPFGTTTALTDSSGIAKFVAIPGPARLIIKARGYKTYDQEIEVPRIIVDVANYPYTSPHSHHQYEVLLEPGESLGCTVIADKQTIGCGDLLNVNVACFGSCPESYSIDCGNGQTTEAKYCREGLCSSPGQCKYDCGEKYKVGDVFEITSNGCENTSVIIESGKERFIVSVSPYQKIYVNPSYDIVFTVVTSKEANCKFEPSSLPFGGQPPAGYFGNFNSADGKTHTYTFSRELLEADGFYSFIVTCYEKTTNLQNTATISFTIQKHIYEFIKDLSTPVSMSVCVYKDNNPVSGMVVLLNIVGLSSLQYHNPAPKATGSDGCAVLDFLAPKYNEEFSILICLGIPKGDNKYLDQQCKEIRWSYPPRPLIVNFYFSGGGVETIQDLKYKECEKKELKIRFDPSEPFFVLNCIDYPNFNSRVIVEGICSIGNEKYSEPYAFSDVRGVIVKKGDKCPSDKESYTSLFSLYGIRTGSSLSHYLSSLSTPCEDGDYLICLIANDTLGIYGNASISASLHIGELENCKISMEASCQNSGSTWVGTSLYRADVDVKVKVENCINSYSVRVTESSPHHACCPLLDYCTWNYHGAILQIYDLDAYEYITFPGTSTEEFSCSSSWGTGEEGYTLHLHASSGEREYTTSLSLNCTESDSGEALLSP